MTVTETPSNTTPDLSGKNVLIGACGGIALYKICQVVSRLAQYGADVRVMMTHGAQQFVGTVTFEALSGNPVYTDMWSQKDQYTSHHINLARDADIVLLAPATANTIGKLAHGICDNLVTTVLVATPRETPVYYAPAMNADMWANPITQQNLNILNETLSYQPIGPADGWQACRTSGSGRMSEADEILSEIVTALTA